MSVAALLLSTSNLIFMHLTNLFHFIHRSDSVIGNQNNLISLVRHLMNRCTTQRTVSKQECMVLLTEITLVQCSENINTINISNSKMLKQTINKSDNMSVISIVEKNENDHSFAQFLHENLLTTDKDGKETVIPHYVGLNCRPTYPITIDYARSTLIINKPWRKGNSPHL